MDLGKPATVRFNVLTIGSSGSGKTTLLKTLFSGHYVEKKTGYCDKTDTNVKLDEVSCFLIKSHTVDCEVRLYESRNYGDSIDNTGAIQTLKKNLTHKHASWLQINGNQMTDKVNIF